VNIAITTIILAILLLPGIVFRRFYYTEEFSKQYQRKNFFELFFSSLIPSLLFHSIWFFVIQAFGYSIDFEVIGYLFSKNSDLAYSNIDKFFPQIILYHLSIILFAVFVGFFSKKIIRNNRIDRRIKFFRFSNSWHYLFSGEFFDFPRAAFNIREDVDEIEYFYVDVVVDTNYGTLLYEGFLVDYELDDLGELDYISIKETQRRLLKDDNSSDKYDIPGHIIIIPYSSIKNINLTFLKLDIEEINGNELQVELVMIDNDTPTIPILHAATSSQ